MSTTEESECRRVVFEFATAINDWEIREYILRRLAIGQHVSPIRTALVAGLTKEALAEEHKDIFRRYIYIHAYESTAQLQVLLQQLGVTEATMTSDLKPLSL